MSGTGEKHFGKKEGVPPDRTVRLLSCGAADPIGGPRFLKNFLKKF